MFPDGVVRVLTAWRSCADAASGQSIDELADSKEDAVDCYSFSFGPISPDKPVSHEFVIENNGTSEIGIAGRTNSCGCVSSTIDREIIPPGESARVTVTLDPAGYSGRVTQFVFVSTDDPDRPAFKFMVEADVR